MWHYRIYSIERGFFPRSDTQLLALPRGRIVLRRKLVANEQKHATSSLFEWHGFWPHRFSKISLAQAALVEEFHFPQSVALPGFFDWHFHWVQEDVRSLQKANLLNWLKKYTWPEEAKYSNPRYAKQKAENFFPKLKNAGTVGGLVYSSIHESALNAAFAEAPREFLIGPVTMNQNAPESLLQTSQEALSILKRGFQKFGSRLVFSPRFSPNVSAQVMKDGAKLAKKYRAWIQTHLSENQNEIEWALKIAAQDPTLKDAQTYTEIYDRCGVLTPRTVLGHCIHLSKEEWKLLAKRRVIIAHCPTSNAPVREKGLGSGLFDFRRAEREGIRWVLASDIGGGPYYSMLDVMRSFIVQNQRRGISKATWKKALYRATRPVPSPAGSLSQDLQGLVLLPHCQKNDSLESYFSRITKSRETLERLPLEVEETMLYEAPLE